VLGDRPAIEPEYPENTFLVSDGRFWSKNTHQGKLDTPVHQLERGGLIYPRHNMKDLQQEAEMRVEAHLTTRYLAVAKAMDRQDASTTDDFEMEQGRISAIGIQGGNARVAVMVFDLEDERYLGSKQLNVEVASGTELNPVDAQGSLEQALSKAIVERSSSALKYHEDPEPEPPADAAEAGLVGGDEASTR
jgi:hypothetical protein